MEVEGYNIPPEIDAAMRASSVRIVEATCHELSALVDLCQEAEIDDRLTIAITGALVSMIAQDALAYALATCQNIGLSEKVLAEMKAKILAGGERLAREYQAAVKAGKIKTEGA